MRFGLTYNQIEDISKLISAHKSIDRVVIFGSRAINTFKPSSDIDFALCGNDLQMDTVYKLSNELDDLLLPVTFDLLIYDKINNEELRKHILRAGQVFYEKGG